MMKMTSMSTTAVKMRMMPRSWTHLSVLLSSFPMTWSRRRVAGKRPGSISCPHSCWSLLPTTTTTTTSTWPLVSMTRSYAKGQDRGKGKKQSSGKGSSGAKPKTVMTDSQMSVVIDVSRMRQEFSDIQSTLKDSYMKNLSLRSGSGIEDLTVQFDGSDFPLKELAEITRKQQAASTLVVLNLSQLPDACKAVMKCLHESGMNLNPQQEGTTIFLTLGKVTRDHRLLLAKSAKTMCTKAKDELSRCGNHFVREAGEAKLLRNVSADTVQDTIDNIRYAESRAIAECEQLLSIKTVELLGQ